MTDEAKGSAETIAKDPAKEIAELRQSLDKSRTEAAMIMAAWQRDREALSQWIRKMMKRANGLRLLHLTLQAVKETIRPMKPGVKEGPFPSLIRSMEITVQNMAETVGWELPLPQIPPLDPQELALWEKAREEIGPASTVEQVLSTVRDADGVMSTSMSEPKPGEQP